MDPITFLAIVGAGCIVWAVKGLVECLVIG